jgi:hypothetical protein
MKISKTAVVGVGVCAAACAGASILPVLAGAGIVSVSGLGLGAWFGGIGLDTIACAAGLVVALGLVVTYVLKQYRRSKSSPAACSTDGICGCGPDRSQTEVQPAQR